MSNPDLTSEAQIELLINLLRNGADGKPLDNAMREKTLEKLKVFSRDVKLAELVQDHNGVELLSEIAFDESTISTSHGALRCLANILLLIPKHRQVFVDGSYPAKAAERMKTRDYDDEFLVSRILFLLTYDTDFSFDDLFESHSLGESINFHLVRHSERYAKPEQKYVAGSMADMAMSESLKLLFNLSHFYPRYSDVFASSFGPMSVILGNISISGLPFQDPVNYLLNALANLEVKLDGKSKSSTPDSGKAGSGGIEIVDRLVYLLDKASTAYTTAQLDTLAVPLLTLLRNLLDASPDRYAQKLQNCLLPENNERHEPIGQSGDLPSRLLRLATSPVAPNLREAISSMLFELSDRDPSLFVTNIGYGFAAGYLMSHSIEVPESAKGTGGLKSGVPINPITGQRMDRDQADSEPEMTEEEKEREAERLFVLFERLRATGVVDVENPVRQAMEKGNVDTRFEEVGDSD